MIWRVPCKIYPIFFTWFSLWNPDFSQVATLENLRCFYHPEKNRADFAVYPSNHFPVCRLNGRQSKLFVDVIRLTRAYLWKVMKGLLKIGKFHNKFEILSSGLRILQISKRNLFDICQITHLIFGKIFDKLCKEKCEYIFVKKLRIVFDWFEKNDLQI